MGDVEEARAASPRGSHGTYDERRVGEGEEERDKAGEPGSEGFAVGEAAVGETGRDAEGLYSVGKEGEREQGERGPAGAEVSEERDGRGQGYQESRDVRSDTSARYVGEADDEKTGEQEDGAGEDQGPGCRAAELGKHPCDFTAVSLQPKTKKLTADRAGRQRPLATRIAGIY